MVTLTLIGSDFSKVPPSRLRTLSADEERIRSRLVSLRVDGAIKGGVLLSTCNRVEVLLELAALDADAAAAAVFGEVGELPLRRLSGRDCVDHLLAVAAGLRSMVLGEDQILGQLGRAFARSEELGLMSRPLRMLRTRVLAAARDVRRRLRLGRAERSVASLAADELLGAGPALMVVGAGETARLAIETLHRRGARDLWIVNRTVAKATALARHFGYRALSLADFRARRPAVDGILFAVHGGHPLLDAGSAHGLSRVIDVSQPSVIDPSLHGVAGLSVLDLDGLSAMSAQRAERMQHLARIGEPQVEAQAERIWTQISTKGQDLGKVVDLHVESALDELDRALRGTLAHLAGDDRDRLREVLVRAAKRNAHFHLKDLRQLARV